MNRLRCFILLLTLKCFQINSQKSPIRLTNLTCDSLNINYLKYTKCQINQTNRKDLPAIYIYGKLMIKSLNNLTINAKLFRKVNRNYRPFLYDDVIDFCDFQQNFKQNIFWNMVFQTMSKYSNINHTCPYEHDIIIDNMVFSQKHFKLLPFPRGNYLVQMIIITLDIKIGQVNGYFDM